MGPLTYNVRTGRWLPRFHVSSTETDWNWWKLNKTIWTKGSIEQKWFEILIKLNNNYFNSGHLEQFANWTKKTTENISILNKWVNWTIIFWTMPVRTADDLNKFRWLLSKWHLFSHTTVVWIVLLFTYSLLPPIKRSPRSSPARRQRRRQTREGSSQIVVDNIGNLFISRESKVGYGVWIASCFPSIDV